MGVHSVEMEQTAGRNIVAMLYGQLVGLKIDTNALCRKNEELMSVIIKSDINDLTHLSLIPNSNVMAQGMYSAVS